jgi:hypothetical protein
MNAQEASRALDDRRRRSPWLWVAVILFVPVFAYAGMACGPSGTGNAAGSSQSGSSASGDLQGGIGTDVVVGDALVNVKSLQAAFQPVSPAQKLSDDALVAPAAGYTFYQAYVRIKNGGQFPLRIDPKDFICQVGNTLSTLELTRSGPAARSIISGTSIDLVLTFRGAAGAEATLIYSPPWYSGIISFNANAAGQGAAGQTTTTANPSQGQPTPTTQAGAQ